LRSWCLHIVEQNLLLYPVVKIEESRTCLFAQDLKISLQLLELVEYVGGSLSLGGLWPLEHDWEESLADRGGD